MPSADVLPGPLQFLSRRNAAIVQPERLNRDVEALVMQIRLQLPPDDSGGGLERPAGESIDEEMRRLRVPVIASTSELVGHEGHVLTVAFDASGELLASGGSDNTARLWDVASGQEQLSVTAKGGRVCSVAIDATRGELLSSSNDVVHVWATRNGGRRTTLAGHTGSVWALALSPDTTAVATASADTSACIWDPVTARRLLTLRGHTGWVTAVGYSPSGDCVATGSTDNTCQLWDPTTGRTMRTFRQHTRSVTSVSFSHDQRLLATASADGTARIWDVGSGQDVHVLIGHRDSVTSVAFAPDDRTVITAGVDGSCRTWDPTSGRMRRVFLGHDRPVHDIAISPDGGSVASAGADGSIRLWAID
jgi:WD40 repeat protein